MIASAEEVEVDVAAGAALREIPAHPGLGSATLVILHRIEWYGKGSTSIRIEEYPRMGVLAETEGQRTKLVWNQENE